MTIYGIFDWIDRLAPVETICEYMVIVKTEGNSTTEEDELSETNGEITKLRNMTVEVIDFYSSATPVCN